MHKEKGSQEQRRELEGRSSETRGNRKFLNGSVSSFSRNRIRSSYREGGEDRLKALSTGIRTCTRWGGGGPGSRSS